MSIGNQMQEQPPHLTTCGHLRMCPPHKDHPACGSSPRHSSGVCCPQELPDISLPTLAVLTFSPYWPNTQQLVPDKQVGTLPDLRGAESPVLFSTSLIVYQLCLYPKENISLVPWKLSFSQQQNYWFVEMSYSPICLNPNLLCYLKSYLVEHVIPPLSEHTFYFSE